jgi:hypothetical protein
MSKAAQPFVHVLLFRCPDCTSPVAAAVATGERNPEDADTCTFSLRCVCGWSTTAIGLSAKRHWVEEWT